MTIDFEGTYIAVEEIDPAPKTRRFMVVTKDGRVVLGYVSWWGGWRKYVFFPNADTIYKPACLREIAAFVEAMTKAHRAAKRNHK